TQTSPASLPCAAEEVGRPIRLPCAPTVWRERLLPATDAGAAARPEIADEDRAPLVGLTIIELAAPTFKPPDLRREQPARPALCATRPVDAPQARLRIKEAQGEAHDAAGGRLQCDLVAVTQPVQHLVRH